MNLTEALLEVAHGDERAVLFTVVEGEGVGRKLLVRLERAETFGDGPPGLAGLAPELRRSGIVEHEGSRVFAEVFGPPPRLIVVGAVDTGEALCAGARALGWHTVCVDAVNAASNAVQNTSSVTMAYCSARSWIANPSIAGSVKSISCSETERTPP